MTTSVFHDPNPIQRYLSWRNAELVERPRRIQERLSRRCANWYVCVVELARFCALFVGVFVDTDDEFILSICRCRRCRQRLN